MKSRQELIELAKLFDEPTRSNIIEKLEGLRWGFGVVEGYPNSQPFTNNLMGVGYFLPNGTPFRCGR